MDPGPFLFLGWTAALIAVWVTAIGASIDALGQPREAWARAGFRRGSWVWQAFAAFLLPVALVYSGLYFIRVRPALVAAARDLAIERTAALVHLPPAHLPPWLRQTEVQIRVSPPAAAALVLPTVVTSFVGFAVGTLAAGGPVVSNLSEIWVLAVVLGAVLGAMGNLRHGITLTPTGVVMRGVLRRHIGWYDVVAITPQSTLGSRYVRVWTRSGRRRRLRAPVTNWGIGRRRFDADFAVLEQWWLAHAPPIG